ncbi:MAG: NAD-dependent succinate-semialdehyde dehydrogenase [Gammaproteobacteria bacterium]|nr:NAD-dependent succinate-semialdehyde dehydrogenase [Gammaproteobacteria bacterium]
MQLKDPLLLRRQCLIDGRWSDADSGATIEVANPASGRPLGTVPGMAGSEARRAIAAAHAALPAWRSRPAGERAAILKRLHALMLEHLEDLARIMTAEQGKPLAEARSEIRYAASFVEWFAEEARRTYGDVVPGQRADRRILVIKQPVGVVAVITPWNFPAAMIARKLAPALAAGCTLVAKPALQTPFSALALAELACRAGVPAGVFNIITGPAAAIGAELTASPLVRKLSFTGSTAVGKLLLAQCAATVKRTSMELGGNAPFIVFDDADIEAAVAGAMASKFRNTGQTCVCANRILVQAGIHDAFVQRLREAVARLRVGDGLQGDTDQGPLIDARALAKVEAHIADALAGGARLVAGGRRHALGGSFFEPTILTGATPAMRLAREETFGPVAAIFRFETEAEALRMANDTESGLAAYLYTRDLGRSFRVAEALEYGMVGLNTGMVSTTVAPFGGIKESGIGREGSKYGIEEYLDIKYLAIAGVDAADGT